MGSTSKASFDYAQDEAKILHGERSRTMNLCCQTFSDQPSRKSDQNNTNLYFGSGISLKIRSPLRVDGLIEAGASEQFGCRWNSKVKT
jgi:hypothetical protein